MSTFEARAGRCPRLRSTSRVCFVYCTGLGRVALLLPYKAVECVQGAQCPFSGLTREMSTSSACRVKFTQTDPFSNCLARRRRGGRLGALSL